MKSLVSNCVLQTARVCISGSKPPLYLSVMNNSIQTIPFTNLVLAFIPVIVVIVIIWKWRIGYKRSIYAISRMLIQLLLIGYFLVFLFDSDSSLIVVAVLAVMLFTSSWIALHTKNIPRRELYLKSFCSILLGGGIILLLITQGVLNLHPWYLPSYVIPLAGMIFANAMNSVSLAVERLEAEIDRNVPYEQARIIALRTSHFSYPYYKFPAGSRTGFSARNDDRSNFIRSISVHSRKIPDHGDVHDIWFSGYLISLLSGFGQV